MLWLALPPCPEVPKLDFQSELSVKKSSEFRSTFFVKIIFCNFKFKTPFLLQSDFDKAAKLDKETWDAYNQGGWCCLIG
jgi:hypothetical protein